MQEVNFKLEMKKNCNVERYTEYFLSNLREILTNIRSVIEIKCKPINLCMLTTLSLSRFLDNELGCNEIKLLTLNRITSQQTCCVQRNRQFTIPYITFNL